MRWTVARAPPKTSQHSSMAQGKDEEDNLEAAHIANVLFAGLLSWMLLSPDTWRGGFSVESTPASMLQLALLFVLSGSALCEEWIELCSRLWDDSRTSCTDRDQQGLWYGQIRDILARMRRSLKQSLRLDVLGSLTPARLCVSSVMFVRTVTSLVLRNKDGRDYYRFTRAYELLRCTVYELRPLQDFVVESEFAEWDRLVEFWKLQVVYSFLRPFTVLVWLGCAARLIRLYQYRYRRSKSILKDKQIERSMWLLLALAMVLTLAWWFVARLMAFVNENPYDVLDIPEESDWKDIRRGYRRHYMELMRRTGSFGD